MLKHILTSLALLLCLSLHTQIVYEDFEGGMADLNWTAVNGTYDGIVANPATDGINPSANVGSYTKSDEHAFSLFQAELAAPLDLSVNNQFTIQIYTAAATQVLLKLEGTAESIELTKNIAVPNVWQEYTFDLSAAAGMTTLNKIVLFFDPGVEDSGDTYLFDNLTAGPGGTCAGVTVDPLVIDDFECQRNGTLGVPGYDLVEVVANPDPSGINTSDSVGQYVDQPGPFAAIVYDYNNPLDLSVNNYICLKVWAPVTGNVLIKLEGGVSPATETSVAITETMTWVEVCADFSDQTGANHERIAFFFNAGQEPGMDEIYYYDDVTIGPAPAIGPLETFEGGAQLGWMPLNNDMASHGTFNGAIPNPDPSGANTTATVGSYTRGPTNFSTLTAVLPDGIDLSGNPQINMQVWAPVGATSVSMQLQSPTAGVITKNVSLDATETWVDLSFDFSDVSDVTDFDRINLLFNPMTTGTGTWYFDNVGQGVSTVDPCQGVAPITNILDDFECQRNNPYLAGADNLEVVNNPDITTANTSLKVGEYTDPPGPFSALVLDLGDTTDFSLYNQASAKIWSPAIVPLLFKLEGGPNPPMEVFVDVTAVNEWVTYQVDFSAAADMGYTRLAIFFNAGNEPGANDVYYIDDIQLNRAPYRGCVSSFETPDFTLDGWRYFANGSLEANAFIIQANPDMDAVNGSATVGTFEEASDGDHFAGMFTDPDAPIALPADNKFMTMKVWMAEGDTVVMKLEEGLDGAPNIGDVKAIYDTPGEWQELAFDFSATPDGALYSRITLILNFGKVPAENATHYFDDISVAGASCSAVGIFEPVQVAELKVSPNPARSLLQIDNHVAATSFQIVNMLGQPVKTLRMSSSMETVQMELDGLAQGMYVLTAFAENGQLVAKASFVKQ